MLGLQNNAIPLQTVTQTQINNTLCYCNSGYND